MQRCHYKYCAQQSRSVSVLRRGSTWRRFAPRHRNRHVVKTDDSTSAALKLETALKKQRRRWRERVCVCVCGNDRLQLQLGMRETDKGRFRGRILRQTAAPGPNLHTAHFKSDVFQADNSFHFRSYEIICIKTMHMDIIVS